MKVRIGYGIGAAPGLLADAAGLGRVIDRLDQLGYDSVWFPERINSPQLDPIVAMAYVAGRVERLKFGPAVSVLPGRNPVAMAKAFASLDVVSNGRCLPAFGLGVADGAEHQAFQVDRFDRAPWLDEALPLMRRLWTGETVEHHGPRFHVDGARVRPTPVQDPFEVWLGGRAPSELRRCGRLGDGWLASFTTPAAVAESIEAIDAAATAAGRSIDRGHFGVLIPYVVDGSIPERTEQLVRARRPDIDPTEVVATGHERLRRLIEEFIAAGASKFVLFPAVEPPDWEAELESAAAATLSLQT
jgi:probable F420-dependent oxidoreductase